MVVTYATEISQVSLHCIFLNQDDTDSAGSMLLPSKLTRKDDFRELLIWSLPIIMNYFNLSLLFPIQAWTASRQVVSSVN